MSAPFPGASRTTDTSGDTTGDPTGDAGRAGSRRPSDAVAALLRPGASPRAAHVSTEEREHAATVVAHLLHRDCAEWSWTSHRPDAHRADARRIVGALCREGWSPAAPSPAAPSLAAPEQVA